jgi:hypothetical protein
MPPHDRSNILELVLYRDSRLAGDRPRGDGGAPAAPEAEVKAIVSSLEYLYGETIKLDRRMAAHLIGAAAEALRRAEGAPEGREGGTQ